MAFPDSPTVYRSLDSDSDSGQKLDSIRGDVEGREYTVNPKDAIPSEWIVIFVTSGVVTLGLTVGMLCVHPGVLQNCLLAAEVISGTGTMALEIYLITHYRKEAVRLEKESNVRQLQDLQNQKILGEKRQEKRQFQINSDTIDSEDESSIPEEKKQLVKNQEAMLAKLQETMHNAPPVDEWNKLKKETKKDRAGHFNLFESDKPVAQETESKFLALPILGKYDQKNPNFPSDSVAWCARLPSQQIRAFPERLRNWFGREEKVKCYVMIFDDPVKSTVSAHKRNFAMHHMALPDYHPNNPSEFKKGENVWADGKGLKTQIQMAMFDPQGVGPSLDGNRCIPDCSKEGSKALAFDLNMHEGSKKGDTRLSSDQAGILIDTTQDVSSAYIGAKFRGEAVAIYAIFRNKPDGEEGKKLTAAMQQETVHGFMEHLSTADYAHKGDLEKMFAHPSSF